MAEKVVGGKRYRVERATISHVYQLAKNLRDDVVAELKAGGFSPKAGVRRCFKASLWARTAFVDDEIAVMWGLGGTLVGNVGYPWMLGTNVLDTLPFEGKLFAMYEAKEEILQMLDQYPLVEMYVPSFLPKTLRLAKHLGFELGEPRAALPHGEMFVPCTVRAS